MAKIVYVGTKRSITDVDITYMSDPHYFRFLQVIYGEDNVRITKTTHTVMVVHVSYYKESIYYVLKRG